MKTGFRLSGKNVAMLLAMAVVVFTILPLAVFSIQALSGKADVSQAVPGVRSSLMETLGSPQLAAALRFTFIQATLSTLLALIIGFPGAYLVARYDFPARGAFFALSAVPFCLPPILVILSFILYYGKRGWFTRLLQAAGLDRSTGAIMYSLAGLVLIHAFYNFPIVIQNVGSVWRRMPKSREEAARTLGAGKLRAFATGTLPFLAPSLIQAASLVFLFCFFSFTIVLVFGGLSGSTMEVEIYRALRFTGDERKALALAAVQTLTALAAVAVFARFDSRTARASKGFGSAPALETPKGGTRMFIAAYEAALLVLFLGPLFSLAAEAFRIPASMGGKAVFGFGNFVRLLSGERAVLARATVNSLALSGSAALIATMMGLALAASSQYSVRHDQSGRGLASSWLTALPLALSPAVIAASWSSLLPGGSSLPIVLGQAALAWPFVARSLGAAFTNLDRSAHEAGRTLGGGAFRTILSVDAPAAAPSIASAAAFAFSLTMGDANIPLVLGGGNFETLPLLLYRLTAAYRFNEACAVGIVLALFTSIAFFMKEKAYGPA
jgi:thiamine transport system permease protein